jgi:Na+-driven multidrug efflux pump
MLIFVLFLAFPHALIHVFLSSHERSNSPIAHLAMSFLIISTFLLLADGMRNLLSAGLRLYEWICYRGAPSLEKSPN